MTNNEHYNLLKSIDRLAKEDGWDKSDAALLVIAYLVESGCITDYDIDKVTQALERCSEWEIGKTAYIERVLKDADKVRQTVLRITDADLKNYKKLIAIAKSTDQK